MVRLIQETYIIEKILDRKIESNQTLYRIKWLGYSMNECTWEPLKNLTNAIQMIRQFNETFHLSLKEQRDQYKNSKLKKIIKKEMIQQKEEESKQSFQQMDQNSTEFCTLYQKKDKLTKKDQLKRKQIILTQSQGEELLEGSYEYDKPVQINGIRKIDGQLEVSVCWEPRENSLHQPRSSWCNYSLISKNHLDLILNYLTSIMYFRKKTQEEDLEYPIAINQ